MLHHMLMENDYRKLIKNKLEESCNSNPLYSLRAFANYLGLDRSSLSAVLKGKQGLSLSKAEQIAKKLNLSAHEKEHFITLVKAKDSRSKQARIEAQKALSKFATKTELNSLTLDAFKIISDWYHYAILELIKTKSSVNNINWISKRLGITRYETENAIERLKRLELIEEKNGKYISTGINLTTTNGIPSEAIRKFNQQILAKAAEALMLQDVNDRDFSTLTFAISKKHIPQLKSYIKEMRRGLIDKINELEKMEVSDEVYHLSTQFFRLTTKEDCNE